MTVRKRTRKAPQPGARLCAVIAADPSRVNALALERYLEIYEELRTCNDDQVEALVIEYGNISGPQGYGEHLAATLRGSSKARGWALTQVVKIGIPSVAIDPALGGGFTELLRGCRTATPPEFDRLVEAGLSTLASDGYWNELHRSR